MLKILKKEYILWNYVQRTGVQYFKPISLFLAVQWTKNQLKVITSSSETQLLKFITVLRPNKLHFWNPETELDVDNEHVLARGRLGAWIRSPRFFFLNNGRSVRGIDAKRGISFRTSILLPQTKLKNTQKIELY